MRRRRIATAVLLVAGLAIVVRLTLLDRGEAGEVLAASGTVEATEAHLGFRIAGRIDAISVREADRVSGEDVLSSLDRMELLARRRAAEAQVASARARLEELAVGFRSEEIAQARASLRAAELRLAEAGRYLERTRVLFEGGAVSQQELDDWQTALDVAQAEVARQGESLRLLESGSRPERIAAQRAALAGAEAAVDEAEALLDYAVITAPFSGLITVRHREPGEIVAAGAPVLTLMNPQDRWVRVYVRADRVGRIAIGQAATITSDAYDDRTYGGRVIFIASEAEYTPRTVQTTEERVKLVYEVRVRIEVDPTFDLKPGLAADVRLDPPES